MPTQVETGSVVGLAYGQAWYVDDEGYAMGTAGPGAPNGTTTHALLLPFPKTAQLPNPARIVTPLTGGNRWLGQVMWGINEVGAFPLTMNDINGALFAMAGGSDQDTTTNQRWRRLTDNRMNPTLPQLGLMLSTLFQSREDGSDGVNLWINYVIPRCQIDPQFSGMAYQAENEVTYTVSPTASVREPNGRLLTAGGMNAHRGRVVMYAIVTPKPLAITTYVNATEPSTTFTLGFLPTDPSVTLNDCANEHAINGTLTALTSVSTTTALATKAAAGTAADRSVVLYETDFMPIPA